MSKGGWRRIAAASWDRPLDPQIYGDLEIDATVLLSFLDETRRETGVHVTVTHAVGRALGHALAEQPDLNTRLVRGRFLPRDSVDIFFVASVAGGEEVSGVKIQAVDTKTLPEVAAELERRVERIRSGDLEVGGPAGAVDAVPFFVLRRALRFVAWLTTDRNRNLRKLGLPRQPFGSAMVTSVGMFGVQKAYGPLSPLYRVPILALVSEVTVKPVVVDGEIVARPMLTCARRWITGSSTARMRRGSRGACGPTSRIRRPSSMGLRPHPPRLGPSPPKEAEMDELPWLAFYGDVPATLDYPEIGLYEALARSVARRPDTTAVDFLGFELTYAELLAAVDRCADGLAAHGLGVGDRITISTPTCPQGVIAFYAAAKLGAVSSLIHPLSTADEIRGYLNVSRSRVALTLDLFYGRLADAREGTSLETLVLARVPDYLSLPKRVGFWWKRGRSIPRVPADETVVWWSQLLRSDRPSQPPAVVATDDLASLLYSGGSTGTPKGIMLSHRNFIAEGMQVTAWVGLGEHDTVLAVLPIFHGFGLGALINAAFLAGAKVVMVPQYSPEIVADLLRTKRPTLTAGPPTLFESLARDPSLQTSDLSSLRAAFCGADTLPVVVRERFEQLVADRGGSARLLEGYGLTEAVTAIMGMPLHERRDGSMGVPFPDMRAKICDPGTTEALSPGSDGEICIAGPAVMLGYLDNPEATAESLRTHADGRVWLHTGDIGRMDEDGFFTFVSRLKRMIKSSGFNVFPAQVEAVLYEHPDVVEACVIGIPDVKQGERVKAFVTVRDRSLEGPELASALIAHCQERLIKWSCPRDVEFLPELPKTRVGKIDFTALARREASPPETTPAPSH